MLNRRSQILIAFLPHQESTKIKENQIFETENEDLRNEVCNNIIVQCSLKSLVIISGFVIGK